MKIKKNISIGALVATVALTSLSLVNTGCKTTESKAEAAKSCGGGKSCGGAKSCGGTKSCGTDGKSCGGAAH